MCVDDFFLLLLFNLYFVICPAGHLVHFSNLSGIPSSSLTILIDYRSVSVGDKRPINQLSVGKVLKTPSTKTVKTL